MMLTITTNSFENDVLRADKPVLVDFGKQCNTAGFLSFGRPFRRCGIYIPSPNRRASMSGRPAARMRLWASATSYSTRRW